MPHRLFQIGCLMFALVALTACDGDNASKNAPPAPDPFQKVDPPKNRPDYSFAPGLKEQYPDAAAFMVTFLETCLAGDYYAYRGLVSRTRSPESEERFKRAYYGLKQVTIEQIVELDTKRFPPPIYLVTVRAELLPEHKAALKRQRERFALLVFKEDGQWRMLPAPSEWQPQDGPGATATSSAPGEPAVEYPWEEGG